MDDTPTFEITDESAHDTCTVKSDSIHCTYEFAGG